MDGTNEARESEKPGGLSPVGKGLVFLGAFFGVVLVLVMIVVEFSSDTLHVRATTSTPLRQGQPAEVAEYRWDGAEPILVTAQKEGAQHPRCTVKADAGGEERAFFAWDVTSKERSKGQWLEPWFDGPATMTCTTVSKDRQTVDVFAADWAERKRLTDSFWFYLIGAVLIGTPILIGIALGKKKS